MPRPSPAATAVTRRLKAKPSGYTKTSSFVRAGRGESSTGWSSTASPIRIRSRPHIQAARRARFAALCCAVLATAVAAASAEVPQRGGLAFEGCVSQLRAGCAVLPRGSLVGTAGIALSPDGRSVYASSYGGDTVDAFKRGGRGGLSFQGCIAGAGARGCPAAPGNALQGAAGNAARP